MKVFKYITPDGNVDVKVDMLTTDLNQPATVMDIKFNITNTALTNNVSPSQAITNFLYARPAFAGLQNMPTTGAKLKAIATSNNYTLNMIDTSSPINADANYGTTVLNTSTTTTTTTTTTP